MSGGMLAAWFRMKYPAMIDGVIAASAPIWAFLGLTPPYDSYGFYSVVTRDASAAGGRHGCVCVCVCVCVYVRVFLLYEEKLRLQIILLQG